MDSLQRSTVSLLIDGDALDPSEISMLLDSQPSLGVPKGDFFLTSIGKEVQAKTGKWQLNGEWESPSDLNRQISDLLSNLTDDLAVWKNVTDRFHCYISIGGYFNDWTGGFTLEPSTAKLLSDRDLAIDFDLYAPDASD